MNKICGFRPSEKLHLGHYFSVIKPAIENNTTVLIADLHVPKELRDIKLIANNYNTLLKYGIKNIKVQSDIFNYKLFLDYLQSINLGRLKKLPNVKDIENPSLHLLLYPVMMAVDVEQYSDLYVGKDQSPHVNIINYLRGVDINVHYTNVQIPDLKLVGNKMSKSNPTGCIFLDDTKESIYDKCKKINNKHLDLFCNIFNINKIENNFSKTKSNIASSIIKHIK